MKKVQSREKLKLHTETVRHLKELAERDLRAVNGGDDTHTGYWWCTSTLNNGG
jgi:hypothetical protein